MINETQTTQRPIELKNVRVVYKDIDFRSPSTSGALCGKDLRPQTSQASTATPEPNREQK